MDWKNEVTSLIVTEFKNYEIDYNPDGDFYVTLNDFMNFRMRLIDEVPRIIYVSDAIKSKKIPNEFIQALNYICDKIQKGINVNFHQSKQVYNPKYKDLLYNDWIIAHLHLSHSKQNGSRYYNRSKYLLFVAFNNSHAFLIDIREHTEKNVFARKEYLEILHRNWPELMHKYIAKNISKLHRNWTDEDLNILRRKGYNTAFTEINGKVFINPGLGSMTNGTSGYVSKVTNSIVRYLHSTYEEIKDEEGMKELIRERLGISIEKMDYCIHLLPEWPHFAFYENNIQQYLEKSPDQFITNS